MGYRATEAPPALGTLETHYCVMRGETFVAGYWLDRAIAEDYATALNHARHRRSPADDARATNEPEA